MEQEIIHCKPDLSKRPFSLKEERVINLSPEILYQAWTEKFDTWFAATGSVLMKPEANSPFFFETIFENQRHPHYGRFLRLKTDKLVELTWITAGTKGVETVVKVELIPQEEGTLLELTHAGFPDEESRDGHQEAWPIVLEELEKKMTDNP